MDLKKICYVTKDLVDHTKKVKYMYRGKPDNDDDSGWRFFSGDEEQTYVDNPANTLWASLQEVVDGIDSSVIKYLESEIGSEYARENEIDEFQKIKNFQFVKKLERS